MSSCRLGAVVASVLATGLNDRGFNPGRGDGFKGDQNPQHTFLRMGSKAGGPMSLRFYGVLNPLRYFRCW
jgi:hypothetical protein